VRQYPCLKKAFFRAQTLTCILLTLFFFLTAIGKVSAKDSDFPPRPNPPKLVNDFAGMMTPMQQDELEQQLEDVARNTSTQITIITVNSLGDYETAQYVTELGNRWGIGQKGKENGVIIFAAKDDHKLNISPGYGLEGALPDITCNHIIQNELVPEFKQGNYFLGFSKAANAVIEATKGEYKADKKAQPQGGFNFGGLIGLLVIIVIVVVLIRKGGGGGGGNYMSHRGGSFLTGAILGSMLGGGRSGGSFGSGGGFGAGGFGGFGGGSFGGGGASGSW